MGATNAFIPKITWRRSTTGPLENASCGTLNASFTTKRAHSESGPLELSIGTVVLEGSFPYATEQEVWRQVTSKLILYGCPKLQIVI